MLADRQTIAAICAIIGSLVGVIAYILKIKTNITVDGIKIAKKNAYDLAMHLSAYHSCVWRIKDNPHDLEAVSSAAKIRIGLLTALNKNKIKIHLPDLKNKDEISQACEVGTGQLMINISEQLDKRFSHKNKIGEIFIFTYTIASYLGIPNSNLPSDLVETLKQEIRVRSKLLNIPEQSMENFLNNPVSYLPVIQNELQK